MMEKNNLITKKQLEKLITEEVVADLLSVYKNEKIKVYSRDIERVRGTLNINSNVWKVRNIDVGSGFPSNLTLYIKHYLKKNIPAVEYHLGKSKSDRIGFRKWQLDELCEKAIYEYGNNGLVWHDALGEEIRAAPFSPDRALPPNNPIRKKFDELHMLSLIGHETYLKTKLEELKKEKESYNEKLKWKDINWIFNPLLLLWVKGTAEIDLLAKYMPDLSIIGRDKKESEKSIYKPLANSYRSRYKSYTILALEPFNIPPEVIEKNMKAFSYFAPFIVDKRLECITHGDSSWRNHLTDVMIDFPNFRLAAWPSDVAPLIENPYITYQLGLRLDEKEILEETIERAIKIGEELPEVKKFDKVPKDRKIIYLVYYGSSLYFRPRLKGISNLHKKLYPTEYQELLAREKDTEKYPLINFYNFKHDYEKILDSNLNYKSSKHAELGLKSHEEFMKAGVFDEIKEEIKIIENK